MYYEIIYENGEHSIASYDSDDEALAAINEHVRRAKAGEAGGPAGNFAQRIVKVLKYDDHPADYSDTANALTKDVAAKTVKDLIDQVADKNGVVNMQALAVAVSTSTSPRVDSNPHESNYKMDSVGELKGVDV